MKQPEILDVGTEIDVARHRLNVAREDLETANLTFEAGQYLFGKEKKPNEE